MRWCGTGGWLITSVSHREPIGSGFQFPDDVPGQMILDFPMPGNGLAGPRPRILIPVMPSAMPDKNTPALLKLADEVDALHAS